MPERREMPPRPENPVCVCGCDYRHHWTQWEGDDFKGTRCQVHGGHKFQLPSTGEVQEGGSDAK